MNELWTKWIILSVSSYVTTFFGSDYVWVQDNDKPTVLPPNRFELRYLGPDITCQTRNTFEFNLKLNCQIITAKQSSSIEQHLLRIGKAQKMLAKCITVYKLGSDLVIDDRTQLNSLQLNSDIMTTPFGTIDPVSSIVRSTVEASYKMTFEVQ